jgi:hypothetical protein
VNRDHDELHEGHLADDEPLGRPFLNRLDMGSPQPSRPPALRPPGPPGPPGPSGPPESPGSQGPPVGATHHGEVRPYLLTGGRTQSRGTAVAMETVVLATGVRPVRASDAAGQERAHIVQLAVRPCSAAEVAAWLHLPLQVALVLVSDLVAEGLLDASSVTTSQSDDVLFLERLIAGVAAL